MRVARILSRLNLGGPARQALASDPRLRAAGVEVRLFAGQPEPGEGDLFDTFAQRGLDVVRVPGLGRGIRPAADLRAARFLRKALADFAPDVVHTHASKGGTLGRRAAVKLGLPCVHTFHGHVLEGYFPEPVSRALVRHERKLAQGTARILTVAHATAEDLLRLEICSEEQLVVVPPGVELDELLALDGRSGAVRELIGAGEDDVVLGVLGRLAEVKRPERALEVFELLAARHPGLHLCFVGDGPERGGLERRILAADAELQRRVHLLGAREDVPAVLADLDGLLLTSRTEGAPVALIEAAAAGLPVIAERVGGVEELVAHERTGFVGEGVEELAYGLDRLLADPVERRAMGHRARLRVPRRHSAEALAGRLHEIYEVVAAEAVQGG